MGIGEPLRPGSKEPVHASLVAGVPDDRVPVGVEDQRACTDAKHTVEFGQCSIQVGDVLVHLSGNRHVEGFIPEWERHSVCLYEAYLLPDGWVGAARSAEGEHAVADLQASHMTRRADLLGHLSHQQARPRSDVEDSLTWS